MATLQCPECGTQVEADPGENPRCPSCGFQADDTQGVPVARDQGTNPGGASGGTDGAAGAPDLERSPQGRNEGELAKEGPSQVRAERVHRPDPFTQSDLSMTGSRVNWLIEDRVEFQGTAPQKIWRYIADALKQYGYTRLVSRADPDVRSMAVGSTGTTSAHLVAEGPPQLVDEGVGIPRWAVAVVGLAVVGAAVAAESGVVGVVGAIILLAALLMEQKEEYESTILRVDLEGEVYAADQAQSGQSGGVEARAARGNLVSDLRLTVRGTCVVSRPSSAAGSRRELAAFLETCPGLESELSEFWASIPWDQMQASGLILSETGR